MKQADVKLFKTYIVKVSGREVPVKVLRTLNGLISNRRWYVGLNLTTNREVQFTAAKCREEVKDDVGAT